MELIEYLQLGNAWLLNNNKVNNRQICKLIVEIVLKVDNYKKFVNSIEGVMDKKDVNVLVVLYLFHITVGIIKHQSWIRDPINKILTLVRNNQKQELQDYLKFLKAPQTQLY